MMPLLPEAKDRPVNAPNSVVGADEEVSVKFTVSHTGLPVTAGMHKPLALPEAPQLATKSVMLLVAKLPMRAEP